MTQTRLWSTMRLSVILSGLFLFAITTSPAQQPLSIECGDREIDSLSKEDVEVVVERGLDLGIDEFLVYANSKYGSMELAEVRLTLVRGGSTILDTYMRQYSNHIYPDRVMIAALVDPTEMANTKITFDYIEPDAFCGKVARLQISVDDLNGR